MNLVGKIFVVLILVASTVFMTLGLMIFATHQNWRAAIITPKTGYQDQLKAAYTDSAKLSSDIDKLNNLLTLEKAAHSQELAKAQTALAKAEEHKADLEDAVAKERHRADTDAKSLEVTQASLTALRKENGGLREDIRDANKKVDEQLKIATETEDKLHIAQGPVGRPQELQRANWPHNTPRPFVLLKIDQTRTRLPAIIPAPRCRCFAGKSWRSTRMIGSRFRSAATTGSARGTPWKCIAAASISAGCRSSKLNRIARSA